jgi:DNA-binding transcriptional LysR family regulator
LRAAIDLTFETMKLPTDANNRSVDQEMLHVKGQTRADNTALVLSLVLEGVGIARLNDTLGSPLVRAGKLVQVLADYSINDRLPIYAVMLHERQRLPKIRACIDYWQEYLSELSPTPLRI